MEKSINIVSRRDCQKYKSEGHVVGALANGRAPNAAQTRRSSN